MKTLFTLTILLALASCGKGPSGSNGFDGLNGTQGEKGEAGKDGKNGKDASTKVIKFCPNLVDSYGVAYSEQGLCIDGKVYAVYSSNKLAALVQLSNGRYVTTTPQGTNCTFTIDDTTCNEVE
jgi:hypothetical protein